MARFPSCNINDQALSARQLRARLHGLHRAEFCHAQGFPNLVRARARRAELRAERKRRVPEALERAELEKRLATIRGDVENLSRWR